MTMVRRKASLPPIVSTHYEEVTVILNDANGKPIARTEPLLISYESGGFGDKMAEIGWPLTRDDIDIVRKPLRPVAEPGLAVSRQ